jgi:hypothetical protein
MFWNNLIILIENNFFCFLVKNFKDLLSLLDNSVHKAHVLEKYHLYENPMFWKTIFSM